MKTATAKKAAIAPPGAGSSRLVRAGGKRGAMNGMLVLAREQGLLSGPRTEVVRGRMPKKLVERAKLRSGVTSDTELLEIALASLALADDFPAWLISQRGSVSKDLELEF